MRRNTAGRMKSCNLRAATPSGSPDQGAIDANSLKTKRFVQGYRGPVEVVHEERDGLPLTREVPADFAQERAGEAPPPEIGSRPDAHELYRLRRDGRVLALCGDAPLVHQNHTALPLDQLADALPVAG